MSTTLFFLIIISFMFLFSQFQLLGLGVLGVGIWLLVTEYSAREVSVLVGSNFFEIGTYMLIAGGGTIALMAFCGCCGTMREDKCVLAFVSILQTCAFLIDVRACLQKASSVTI